jgi:hypothetical protein
MDEKIKSYLKDFELNEPTTPTLIKEVEEQLNFIFPEDYFELLLHSNGGEGSIGESYLVLWKVEELIELNEAYGAQEFTPGLLIIGSDGGDTAYCIDTKSDFKPFVHVPFIGMDLDEVERCGGSLQEFFSYLHKA